MVIALGPLRSRGASGQGVPVWLSSPGSGRDMSPSPLSAARCPVSRHSVSRVLSSCDPPSVRRSTRSNVGKRVESGAMCPLRWRPSIARCRYPESTMVVPTGSVGWLAQQRALQLVIQTIIRPFNLSCMRQPAFQLSSCQRIQPTFLLPGN